MKTRGKVVQRYDGEWFDTERFHKFFCCDSGLAHVARFRVRKGKIEMQVIRDNRATGQRRRKRIYSSAFLMHPQSINPHALCYLLRRTHAAGNP